MHSGIACISVFFVWKFSVFRLQGKPNQTARQAKITPAFKLPCEYVIHTVGPIVQGRLTTEHEELLASCYRSCLEIADTNHVESIAFCCISRVIID